MNDPLSDRNGLGPLDGVPMDRPLASVGARFTAHGARLRKIPGKTSADFALHRGPCTLRLVLRLPPARLTRSDADGVLHGVDEDLPVPDLSGPGPFLNDLHRSGTISSSITTSIFSLETKSTWYSAPR